MARPKKQGLDYFPHDVDAVNDEKIEAMRAAFGNDGYAFYFILLERIYRTEDGSLDISSTMKKSALAVKVGVAADRFEEMLQASVEVGLFLREAYEAGALQSNGVNHRFDEVNKSRDKWRRKKEGVFPGENQGENHEKTPEKIPRKPPDKPTPPPPPPKAPKDTEPKKVKYAEYVNMADTEYASLVEAHGEAAARRMVEILDNYKGANGKRYKSDYRAILNWVVTRYKEEQARGGSKTAKTPDDYKGDSFV